MACVPTAFHHPSKCLDKGHGRTGATHVTSSQKPATTTDNFPPHGNLTPPGVAPPPPAWSGRRSSQPASASWRGPSVSQPATPARIAARPPARALMRVRGLGGTTGGRAEPAGCRFSLRSKCVDERRRTHLLHHLHRARAPPLPLAVAIVLVHHCPTWSERSGPSFVSWVGRLLCQVGGGRVLCQLSGVPFCQLGDRCAHPVPPRRGRRGWRGDAS
jgi:hypothetical protein